MTFVFSYDPTALGPPATLNTVRWFIGDTDINYPQLQDPEVTFALTVRGDAYSAAVMCAQALAGKYSRLVSITADGVSMQNQQKATAYAILAKEYAAKSVIYTMPYAGAISQADMYAVMSDPDRVPEIFRLGMYDNPPNAGVSPKPRPGGSSLGSSDFTSYPFGEV